MPAELIANIKVGRRMLADLSPVLAQGAAHAV